MALGGRWSLQIRDATAPGWMSFQFRLSACCRTGPGGAGIISQLRAARRRGSTGHHKRGNHPVRIPYRASNKFADLGPAGRLRIFARVSNDEGRHAAPALCYGTSAIDDLRLAVEIWRIAPRRRHHPWWMLTPTGRKPRWRAEAWSPRVAQGWPQDCHATPAYTRRHRRTP